MVGATVGGMLYAPDKGKENQIDVVLENGKRRLLVDPKFGVVTIGGSVSNWQTPPVGHISFTAASTRGALSVY